MWLCQVLVAARGIFDLCCGVQTLSCDSMWDLIPWPGIEPGSPALGVQSLSHWTTREVPQGETFDFDANYGRSLWRAWHHLTYNVKLSLCFCVGAQGTGARTTAGKPRGLPIPMIQVPPKPSTVLLKSYWLKLLYAVESGFYLFLQHFKLHICCLVWSVQQPHKANTMGFLFLYFKMHFFIAEGLGY